MLLLPMVAQQEVGSVLIYLHKHYQPSLKYLEWFALIEVYFAAYLEHPQLDF